MTDNGILARRYLSELWSRGDLATADELLTADCALHDPLCGDRTGRAAIKAAVAVLRLPFPDLAVSIDAIVVEAGAQIALRWFAHGTHRGALYGIPPTGRAFLISGLLLLRFAAGRLAVITASWEPILLLEQLGLLASSFDPAPCQPLPVPPPEPIAFPPTGESELDAGWA
jgi:steroid delta-isomerase-like uncharacterized protein